MPSGTPHTRAASGTLKRARRRHVRLEAHHVALDERAVERVAPLQLAATAHATTSVPGRMAR